MELDIWHIDGQGFHFGRHGLGQEESSYLFSSDTVFAALVARLADRRGSQAAADLVTALKGDVPPFVLSSAFPRAASVYFFPPPLRPPQPSPKTDALKPKDLKRVRFVSESRFRALLAGKSLAELMHDSKPLHRGQVLYSEEEGPRLPPAVIDDGQIWDVEKRPRVTVGRAAQNSQIYFTGRTVFHRDCGLWLAVRWLERSSRYEDLLADLFAELGDAGLGGERSTGFGQCRIVRQERALDLPAVGNGLWVSLSRYLPRSDEMPALRHPSAAYVVETVGGWVEGRPHKSERRRSVRMLTEGATLGPVSRAVPGQIVDVQPDYEGKQPIGHPVWRSGLALAVGCQEEAK
jgi:CRISPR-associated protein Csm4